MEAMKENKYLVVKTEDLREYLASHVSDAVVLDRILGGVMDLRQANSKPRQNKYILVNEDEPYAKYIWDIVLAEEGRKKKLSYGSAGPEGF